VAKMKQTREHIEKRREALKKWHKEKGYVPAWNKGLTKETDERVMKYSKSLVGHKGAFAGKKRPEHSEIMKGRKFSTSHKEKIGKSIRENPFVVHHINGNHFDDRPENRIKITRTEHQKLHNKLRRIENSKNTLAN